MRLNQIDLGTMNRLVQQLCAAYGKPFGASGEAQVRAFHKVLADFSIDEVESAVNQACKTLERFPNPAKLRQMCYAGRPKRVLHHDDPSDNCRDCGTAYQWRRLPHWIQGAQDLQCDCGWRNLIRGYATEEDLDALLEAGDPHAEQETRRRAAKQQRAA